LYFRQCILQKGNTTKVTWLPEKYAKVGKILELKVFLANDDSESDCILKDGGWEDGWKVAKVGTIRLTKEENSSISRDYRYHRKRTDV